MVPILSFRSIYFSSKRSFWCIFSLNPLPATSPALGLPLPHRHHSRSPEKLRPPLAPHHSPPAAVLPLSPALLDPFCLSSRRDSFSSKMVKLKIPEHQVAGHQAKTGIIGPLIDDSGKFYKPLQDDERGSNELAFYTSIYSDPRIPSNILKFFPSFHGTEVIDASDGSGLHPHLVLEDIVNNYTNPSVADIKIGSRTWHPQSSEDYIRKCLQKDRESSTIKLGFRISGLRSMGPTNQLWQPHRKVLMDLSAKDVMLILRKFVSSDGNVDEPDCVFASRVFIPVLEELLELKKWFEVQTIFHFCSCSVLVVYDKEEIEEKKSARAVVKLIDFAHVVDAKGAIDHNFLGGLCSLIKFVKDLLAGLSDVETSNPKP